MPTVPNTPAATRKTAFSVRCTLLVVAALVALLAGSQVLLPGTGSALQAAEPAAPAPIAEIEALRKLTAVPAKPYAGLSLIALAMSLIGDDAVVDLPRPGF